MGLDIYAGTLTRYYSGNWKLITQQVAEELGMSFSITTPEGQSTSPNLNPEEVENIQNCIQEWQTYLSDSMPTEYKETHVGRKYGKGILYRQAWIRSMDGPSHIPICNILKKAFP